MLQHPDHYRDLLVLFSVIIALLSCFSALDLAERLIRENRGHKFILLLSGLLGTGMWSMHFIGMRAMRTDMSVAYDFPLLLLSLIVPVAASYALFLLLSSPYTRNRLFLAFGGVLFSAGILIMHYCGILSMKFFGNYEQSLLSILYSFGFALIVPAVVCLYNPRWIAGPYNMLTLKKVLLVLVLTACLSGSHYAAMDGAVFSASGTFNYSGTVPLLPDSLLAVVLAVSFLFIVMAVLILLYRDRQRILFSASFNEQRYTALFDSSPDMVLCIDPVRRKVISSNPSLQQTTGYRKEELGDYKSIFSTPKDEAMLKQAVERAVSGHSSKIELEVIIKNGGTMICSTTVFPLLHGNQKLVYLVAEDITPFIQFQQQLIEAKEAAEGADRMKSEFLTTMSHEIRTPLNGIIGINQLLADDIAEPGQQELLRLQYNSSQALLSVVNDVLDFSRLDSDGLQLRSEAFPLQALLTECSELFESAAKEKGLQLKLQVTGDIPEYVKGDSLRIRQILVNLIGNAVKFTPDGGVTIEVGFSSVEGTKGEYTFRIKDTGIGIPADKLPLLFQPFTQLDASHNRQYPGTGLGLAICRKLVELMDGNIRINSEPGTGTEAVFSLMLDSGQMEGEESRDFSEPDSLELKTEAV
ncbi:ATP-binding protein [Paenibacillus sp. FSL R7-0331]|uniref:ATP-binding protein n=1 Tax=Paenibacillus sp. FSL R7-0331 TaxID=1536773 RepID=UPI0006944E1A|nr:ATP-binding protein [Paenibacillus sp. FSL R7-0331]